MADLITTLSQAGIDAACIDVYRDGFQRVPTDDKPHRRNGAVIVLSVRPLRVWFTNHGTGVSGMYAEGGGSGLPSRAELHRMMRARREQAHAREQSYEETATRAEAIWRSARRASNDHPYLVKKRVRAHSIRQHGDALLVPLRYRGRIYSLQTITPEGDKRFLYGGRVKGCHHGIGVPGGLLIVAEGYATAAALHEVLELGVAVAFNAGNLKAVAIDVAEHYPQSRIVIAADNDAATPGNPGVRYGTEAAAAVGGIVIAPQFGLAALKAPLTDWNDYRNKYGDAALKACFDEVYRRVG